MDRQTGIGIENIRLFKMLRSKAKDQSIFMLKSINIYLPGGTCIVCERPLKHHKIFKPWNGAKLNAMYLSTSPQGHRTATAF